MFSTLAPILSVIKPLVNGICRTILHILLLLLYPLSLQPVFAEQSTKSMAVVL